MRQARAALQEAGNLIPAVGAILTSGSANWNAQLTALEGVGESAVICAVKQAILLLAGQLPAANLHAQVDPKLARGIELGKEYLASKGVK